VAGVEGQVERVVLRFYTRRVGKRAKPVEVVHFYSPRGGRVFHAICERGVVTGFLERVGAGAARSRTGKALYLEGDGSERLFRKLVILAGCRQCVRASSKVLDIARVVAGLGEFETLFWYTRMIEGYEKRGFWGVCRVARAFRALYGID